VRSKERAKLKVVLDTSVSVAALLSKSGASAKIVQLIFSGRLYNFYTDEIAEELNTVLQRRKFKLEREKREHFVHMLNESSFLVQPLAEFEIAKCRDPKDDKFLSLSNQAEVDYLISLDADLLDLKKVGRTIIAEPGAFLERAIESGRQ